MNDPSQSQRPSTIESVFFPQFAKTAAAAALFELKLRLVADREEATREYALKDLGVVANEIISAFGAKMSAEDQELVRGCVVLRNKLFHQELSRVTGKLKSLGEHIPEGGVWMGDLSTGDATRVATTSTQAGRIVGWLMESATSGAFAKVAQRFDRARAVLTALLDQIDEEGIARSATEPRMPILPNLEQAIETISEPRTARPKQSREPDERE